MGLGDIVDQHGGESTDSSTKTKTNKTTRRNNSEDDELVCFGQEPNRKCFQKEDWEDVKRYIREEMKQSVSQVVNASGEKRYELLHEAKLGSEGALEVDRSDNTSTQRCGVCGKDCRDAGVEIAGEMFHVQHTAAQLASYFEE